MIRLILLSLALTGCTKIEYIERPAPDYLKEGCQVPYADASETVRDALLYIEKLKTTICHCDSNMRRFTGEEATERMVGVCGLNQ